MQKLYVFCQEETVCLGTV